MSRFSIPIPPEAFRRAILAWYDANARKLPWRNSKDLYRVLVSEIMLQQTRVEAVIPYYEEFLGRFPTAAVLAGASEDDVLRAWAGLGYYSRARNLQAAAAGIVAHAPRHHADLIQLKGVGPYTAAALASICLHEPFAAVDGNVLRVISRLTDDASEIGAAVTKNRFTAVDQELLDPRRPGDFNQAMMELGATVCTPAKPRCDSCPVVAFCAARQSGRERELPVKLRKAEVNQVELNLLLCEVDSHIYLVRRGDAERRLAGFWELPTIPEPAREPATEFRHQIVNDRFRVRLWTLYPRRRPARLNEETGSWVSRGELSGMPITTISRKALRRAESRSRGREAAV